jgi:RimJ/RimL family protein N-acetyltransferase
MKCQFYHLADQDELEIFMKIMYETRGLNFDPLGLQSDIRQIDNVYFLNGGNFWLLKEKNNKVIGSVGLKILDEIGRIGEIKRFFVLPEYQGNGFGKLLLKTAIDYAKERELRRVRLDTMKSSIVAQAIFKQVGFYEIPKYNNNDIAELFLELLLE